MNPTSGNTKSHNIPIGTPSHNASWFRVKIVSTTNLDKLFVIILAVKDLTGRFVPQLSN